MMPRRFSISPFLLGVFLGGVAFVSWGPPVFPKAEKKEAPVATGAEEKSFYRIQAGDALAIEVWRVPLLSTEVRVELDGTFRYPLLGSVPAEGKTMNEVRDYLTRALAKEFLVDPLVSVTVSTAKTRGFFVVGEVKNPGSFQFEERIDIYQAIIMAGGFTDFASKRVKIIRKKSGKKDAIKVDINKYEKDQRFDPRTEIQPGDIIVVRKRLI